MTPYPGALDANYLRDAVEREVLPVFRTSSSPKLPDAEARDAVRLLFELLDLRLDDPSLAQVGPQSLGGLGSVFRDEAYAKISDRFEPFAKLVLKLTRPQRYADLAAKHPRGVNLGALLQACGLAEERGDQELGCVSVARVSPCGPPWETRLAGDN
ncbi:MAG: hypothetical protein M5U12_34395 [Verrucomicrobia bacterium]|nr:hypothetical protein [Verrucomicrobiota bacterium]